jgi:endonuclease-8
MPEGHTLHRLARDQRRDLVGGPVAASSPQGRFTEGAARLDGRVLEGVEAFGKYLFHRWEGGEILHIHLGLIGKLRRQPAPPEPPRGLIRLRLIGPTAAWDLSGPNRCALISPDERDAIVAKLGPDPLRKDADPMRFVDRLARSRAPIGTALLDQTVIAGIGNVFRAEILFLEGIHPSRRGCDLSEDEVWRLWHQAKAQLELGLRRNRIVTVDPVEIGKPLRQIRREEATYAYHQEGCIRCGEVLEVLPLGGRRTWACRVCQPPMS